VLVEQKGSGCALRATKIWITSNVDPVKWYVACSDEQRAALLRRLEIFYCPVPMWTNTTSEEDAIKDNESECSLTKSEINAQINSTQ